MSRSKTYTQSQIEAAKLKLNELPDLSAQKISTADALVTLRDQIVELASKKGYSSAEIKTALEGVGLSVTVKAINEIISTSKARSSRTRTPKAVG